MKAPKNLLLEMLKKMLEIRYFEEKVVDQYARGAVPGLAHLYIGEEAVAVGACMNLTDEEFSENEECQDYDFDGSGNVEGEDINLPISSHHFSHTWASAGNSQITSAYLSS